MNQHTPTLGKQLSSSLRERLKKCGRYHASPQSTSTSGSRITKLSSSIPSEKDGFLSPVSRKRGSTSPLNDTAKCSKLGQNENESPPENVNLSGESTVCIEPVTNEKETEIVKGTPDVFNNRTPLSSKSRSTQGQIKSSRLSFPCRNNISHRLVTVNDRDREVVQGSSQTDSTLDKNDFSGVGNTVECGNGSGNVDEKTDGAVPTNRQDLLKEIAEKEETLRKLKMVKTYRSKNDLTDLQVLIDKWREVSQQALQDLQSEMPDPKPTLTQLINHLGIEHDLIKFDPEEETFDC